MHKRVRTCITRSSPSPQSSPLFFASPCSIFASFFVTLPIVFSSVPDTLSAIETLVFPLAVPS